MRGWFVYIMSNKAHTLYTGITNDLPSRVIEHKTGAYPNGFTARYTFDRCVYYEVVGDKLAAARREKEVKGWRRSKKIELIEEVNPEWNDLTPSYLHLLALE